MGKTRNRRTQAEIMRSKRERIPGGALPTAETDPGEYARLIEFYDASKMEIYIEAGRMYAKGNSYSQIAEYLKVSKSTAHRYVKRCQEYWLLVAAGSYNEKLREVYTDIDALIHTAYQAFEQSRAGETKTVERAVEKYEDETSGANLRGIKSDKRVEHKSSAGNPAFLQIVAQCIQRKAAVLGLEKEADSRKGLASFLQQGFKDIDEARFLVPSPEDLRRN